LKRGDHLCLVFFGRVKGRNPWLKGRRVFSGGVGDWVAREQGARTARTEEGGVTHPWKKRLGDLGRGALGKREG